MYKFAELFTEEPRRYAAALHYERTDDMPGIPEPRTRIDDTFYCPIGAILDFCDMASDRWYTNYAPTAEIVWDILKSSRCAIRPSDYASIAGFIKSWDQGKITNLAEALGV
jgi:hypothetical protein